MKNVYEVLQQKEQELASLEKQVEALRIAAPLLHELEELNPVPAPVPASPAPAQSAPEPKRLWPTEPPAGKDAPAPTTGNDALPGWAAATKRWP